MRGISVFGNLIGWKSFVFFSFLYVSCEKKCTTQFQTGDVKMSIDTAERRVLFEELGDTGQSWFMRIDSSKRTFTVVKWNANGSQVGKVFDKNFKLIRIDWYDAEGSYANTVYHPGIGNYVFEHSPDFKLDSSLMYQSRVVAEKDRGKYLVSISSDFFPIQSVFPSVNSKYDLRYDIPNNTVYVEMDSTFAGKSVQLTYSAFVGNELINFDSPVIVNWLEGGD